MLLILTNCPRIQSQELRCMTKGMSVNLSKSHCEFKRYHFFFGIQCMLKQIRTSKMVHYLCKIDKSASVQLVLSSGNKVNNPVLNCKPFHETYHHHHYHPLLLLPLLHLLRSQLYKLARVY